MKNTVYHNFWDLAETVLRGQFITLNACTGKEEISKISNISFYLRKLKKEKQFKTSASKRKEII